MSRFSIFFCLLALALKGFSQQPVYLTYGIKDGLPSLDVYRVFEDSRKLMWFTSENGVTLYNGTEFKNFSTRDGLGDNIVIHIYEDSKKRVWLNSLTGLPCYYRDGQIHKVKGDLQKVSGFLTSVIEDNQHKILFGCYAGILELNEMNDSLIYHSAEKVNHSFITLLDRDAEGNFLCISSSSVFVLKNDFSHVQNVINDIHLKPENDAIFTTFGYQDAKKIYSFENAELKVKDPVLLNAVESACRELKNINLNFLKIIGNEIYLGSYDHGLFRFTKNFPQDKIIQHYFDNEVITSLQKDFQGHLWASTLGYGVYCMPNPESVSFTQKTGLAFDKVNSILSFKDTLVLGLNEGVFQIISKNKFTTVKLDPKRIIHGRVLNITRSKDGVLYFGTDEGAFAYKKGKISFVRANADNSYSVKCLSSYVNNSMLFGLTGTLFYVKDNYSKDLGKSLQLYPSRFRALFYESGNEFYAGCSRGLFKIFFDPLTEKLSSTKILSEPVSGICKLGDILVLSTRQQGLLFMKNNRFYSLTEKNGLKNNVLLDVKAGNNCLWVVHPTGLSKVKILDLEKGRFIVRNFNNSHGLASSAVTGVSINNDSIWIATYRGATFFKDSTHARNCEIPLYITSITAKNLSKDSAGLENIPFNQNEIRIGFEGVSYVSSKLQYKYRLIGLDSSWTYSKTPEVRYASLAPGSYLFEINVRNEENNWRSNPTTIRFTICKPFWQSWWFYLLESIVLLGFIFGIIQLRVNNIRKKEEEKTQLNKKIAEIELKALRSQMNPHFTFNCMNAILNIIAKRDYEAAHKYLSMFSRLLRLILEHSNKSFISIEEELTAIRLYMELEKLRFKDKFNFDIIVDKAIDVEEDSIPSMLLQPYIENAIWHGLMHKEGSGTILIKVEKELTHLKCTVEDNGIGMEKANEIKQSKKNVQKSLGMHITKERLEILNLKTKYDLASVMVSDVINEEGEVNGTKIIIRIPLN